MIKDNQFFTGVKDNDKKDVKNDPNKNEKKAGVGVVEDVKDLDEKGLDKKGLDEKSDEDLEDIDDEDEVENKSVFKDKLKHLILFCKNNKKGTIIAFIIIVVICVGVTAVVALGKNGKVSNADVNTELATTTTKIEHVDVIPAEVGDIDDPNDPQLEDGNNSEGTGVQMSASDMKKTNSMSNGIDLSKFQGKVDWDAVAATKR